MMSIMLTNETYDLKFQALEKKEIEYQNSIKLLERANEELNSRSYAQENELRSLHKEIEDLKKYKEEKMKEKEKVIFYN